MQSLKPAKFDSQRAPVEYYSLFFPDRLARKGRPATLFAIVAELADAHGSGPCTRKGVGVRVPSMAPIILNLFPLGALCSRVRAWLELTEFLQSARHRSLTYRVCLKSLTETLVCAEITA
jgi:hypothetical protein